MNHRRHLTHSVEILEEDVRWTQVEICEACNISIEELVDYVAEGLVDPVGRRPTEWRFHGVTLQRIRFAKNVQQDLGVNAAGAALALDLLQEISRLKRKLGRPGT